ncbi:hypothetical protein F4802DRAFT_619208 [Xylaria palmicola]|nr:hypothetical protein F4802DRAFT_619208 [Xylaria palmicola]
MSLSLVANTLVRSSARAAPQRVLTRASQGLRRAYATERPTLPEGNGNKPIIIAMLVGVPALAYFIIPSRTSAAQTVGESPAAAAARRPSLDPAAAKRGRDEHEHEHEPDQRGRKYVHPEHEHPETFKPAFGQLHQAKRVDSPPDGRHHQSLSDRVRQY